MAKTWHTMHDLSELQGKGDAKTVKPATMAVNGDLRGAGGESPTASESENAHWPRGDPDISGSRGVAYFMTQWGEIGDRRTHFALALPHMARIIHYCFVLLLAWILRDTPGQLADVVGAGIREVIRLLMTII